MWPCDRAPGPPFQCLRLVILLHTSALDEFLLGWVELLIGRKETGKSQLDRREWIIEIKEMERGDLWPTFGFWECLGEHWWTLHWVFLFLLTPVARTLSGCIHCLHVGKFLELSGTSLPSLFFDMHPSPHRAEELGLLCPWAFWVSCYVLPSCCCNCLFIFPTR